MKIRWKTALFKLWTEWIRPLLIVLVVLGAFRSAVANWYDVPTGSMKPTILEGDRIFVNQLAYDLRVPFTKWRVARWGDPQRGDIVICHSPADGKRLVKRVIAIPGDEIEIRNNRVFLNGQPLEYGPLDPDIADQLGDGDPLRRLFATERLGEAVHPIMLTPRQVAPRTLRPISVPPGQYFVMGDNRDQSGDSRVFGFVPRDEIMGRSSAVVMSLDRSRYYCPRWNRFFHRLD